MRGAVESLRFEIFSLFSHQSHITLFREESALLVEEVLYKDCVLISLESSIFSALCRSFASHASRFEVTRCNSNSGRTEEHDCSGALRDSIVSLLLIPNDERVDNILFSHNST